MGKRAADSSGILTTFQFNRKIAVTRCADKKNESIKGCCGFRR